MARFSVFGRFCGGFGRFCVFGGGNLRRGFAFFFAGVYAAAAGFGCRFLVGFCRAVLVVLRRDWAFLRFRRRLFATEFAFCGGLCGGGGF